ncbi:MAG: plasmid replication protein RepC [Beijerinckiaceae bacterium]
MQPHISTTPFGRRSVTLGQIAAQMQVDSAISEARKPGSNHPAAVNKWTLFRTLTVIKDRIGISDRSLSVLNALLSFQQETALTVPAQRNHQSGHNSGAGGVDKALEDEERAGQGASCDLVVFPSNKALCLRAHGMAEKTVRRHLAALVDAGLIFRRDSPNGKRYARKDQSGVERFSDAFGFDLTPLVTRAAEFESLAEELRRENRALQLTKERISLHRRDIAKLIACGLDEGLEGPWETARQRFMALVTPLRRIKTTPELDILVAELADLRAEVAKILEDHINSQILTGNDGSSDRHQSNSNSQCPLDFEPASEKAGAKIEAIDQFVVPPQPETPKVYPLGMVMEACPDVRDYASGGSIRNWPDFIDSVRLVRPMLGISPDAWREAIAVLGETEAAVVVATILQRSEHSSEAKTVPGTVAGAAVTSVNGSSAIKSAGGYLRALTQKARAGEFALGPTLMALMGQRLKARRAAS